MDKVNENLIYIPSSPYIQAIVKYSEKVAPGKNKYIIMDSPEVDKFLVGINVRVCTDKFGSVAFWDYVGSLDSYKRIIINYPNKNTTWLLDQVPLNLPIKIIWVFWSGELYNLPKFLPEVYQPFSKRFIFTGRFFRSLLKEEVKAYIFNRTTNKKLMRSFGRFTHFACIVRGDYENVKKLLNVCPDLITFSFQSYRDMFSTDQMIMNDRNKVMIGHSGAPEINHYEAFKLVKNLNVSNPILVPLAYGDQDYINAIIKEGNKDFNRNIEFQTDFLSKEEYYRRLGEVGFAIFNLNIQQGFGNIIGLIWLGVKVFLRKSNTIFDQLKEWDIYVFSIEEDLTEESLKEKLNTEQVLKNRKIIETVFSEEKVSEYYRNILQL